MYLSTFIVAVFCLIDDRLKGRRIRQRGPAPKLSDAEVLTIEIVGEFLGIDTDKAIYLFLCRHYGEWFPALGEVHRTLPSLGRQPTSGRSRSASGKSSSRLLPMRSYLRFALVDSIPLVACLFARAYRCRRFKGEAAFGKDTLLKQTFYGFRVHMRVCWPGVISRLSVAPANAHELSVLPELLESTRGFAVGDRNYWSPHRGEKSMGVELLAPYRTKKGDPAPKGAPC